MVMTIFHFFTKFAVLYVGRGLFLSMGGVWSLNQPVTGTPSPFQDEEYAAPAGAIGSDAEPAAAAADPYASVVPVAATPEPAGPYAGYQAGVPIGAGGKPADSTPPL